MNWIDVIIILLSIAAVFAGLRAGLLELILSFSGLVLGLLIGSRLAQAIVTHVTSQLLRFVIIIVLEFGLSTTLWNVGLIFSRRIRPRPRRKIVSRFNEIAGGVIDVLFVLIICWLIASGLSNIPSYNIGRDIKRSYIIGKLNAILPAPPDVFAQLEKIVSPNGFPSVFLGLEPSHTTISPTNSVDNAAVLADEQSVVKIQGVNCGSIIYGSGFVVAKGLVVTDAHVVAGMMRPQVVDAYGTYSSKPVWFDPQLDISVLRVSGNLRDPPLKLSDKVIADAHATAILGFPGGGSLVAKDGAVIDHVTAVGRNIYGQGIVARKIYEVQAPVEEGDSGGPLLASDGAVAGVIFAKSITQNNIGYALLINQVKPLIANAQRQNTVVDTGACLSN